MKGERTREVTGTRGFADAVVARLGRTPAVLPPAARGSTGRIVLPEPAPLPPERKDLMGIDVFADMADWDLAWRGLNVAEVTDGLSVRLKVITNRGQVVWPGRHDRVRLADHGRMRFLSRSGNPIPYSEVVVLLHRLNLLGIEPIKTENLYAFSGERGWSLAQGEGD
jgi:isocitrate dehydrogenase